MKILKFKSQTPLIKKNLKDIRIISRKKYNEKKFLKINFSKDEIEEEPFHLCSSTCQKEAREFIEAWDNLKISDGILVPGGFGIRGIEGKIKAAEYARVNKIPYLGVCLGLQIATIEFCRNVLGMKNANSTEFDENTPQPAVVFMPEISKTHMGGTMRLGTKPTPFLVEDCKIKRLYGNQSYVDERHRHRYEVNINLKNKFENKGMIFSGLSPDNKLPEIIELKNHPWFIGVQYHPEFKSRPLSPHPLFSSFIKAAKNHK